MGPCDGGVGGNRKPVVNDGLSFGLKTSHEGLGLGFRGLGFRVQGLGFRVQGCVLGKYMVVSINRPNYFWFSF